MVQKNTQSRWRVNWLRPRLLGRKHAVRPAEIGDGLCRVLLAQENLLEDANYNKVVPNRFVVEVSSVNFKHHFEPLGTSLIEQWRERLVEHLLTANNRLGRKEYRLGGQLHIELRPSPGMDDNQARILSRVEPDLDSNEVGAPLSSKALGREIAFLEMFNGSRRWPLRPGNNIIGRDESCDIFLDLPLIQEKRLVSSQHAIIRVQDGRSLLLDGDPSGKPSVNGTYVNDQRVSQAGVHLKDGDVIILAALDPRQPRLDTPGVAAFQFRKAPLNAEQLRDPLA